MVDRYSKVTLTIIAACLCVLVFQNSGIVREAFADTGSINKVTTMINSSGGNMVQAKDNGEIRFCARKTTKYQCFDWHLPK